MVSAADKRNLVISRLCLVTRGIFALGLLVQIVIFVRFLDDGLNLKREYVLSLSLFLLPSSPPSYKHKYLAVTDKILKPPPPNPPHHHNPLHHLRHNQRPNPRIRIQSLSNTRFESGRSEMDSSYSRVIDD